MHITVFDKPAPEEDLEAACPEGGRLVRAFGEGIGRPLVDNYLTAARALGADLMRQGAAPAHIRRLTIRAEDPDSVLTALPELDLRHREALAGNFGDTVALIAGEGLSLEAVAIVPPTTDALVFGPYDGPALNRQYSPRSSVPEAGDIMATWRREGTIHQAGHAVEVIYGPAPAHRLDLYRPVGIEAPPVHVFIHGGYWQALDKRDNGYLLQQLVDHGIAVAALNYPLCPPARIPDTVDACRAAIRHLQIHAGTLGLAPGPLSLSGHSAGGHLVAMMACTDWEKEAPDLGHHPIRGVLSISGVFDIVPLVHTGLNSALKLSEPEARDVSPALLPLRSPSPFIAAVGGAESDEFRRQSRDFVDSNAAAGADIEYLELPGKNHFTVLEALRDPASPLLKAALRLSN